VVGEGFFASGLPAWFTAMYGQVFLLVLLLAGAGIGVWKKGETRSKAILLLAWILPYSWVVVNSSSQRPHYWLPIVLPAYLFLLCLLPDTITAGKQKWHKALLAVALVGVAAQALLFVMEDVRLYQQALHKEETSAALQFSVYVKEEIILPDAAGDRLSLYRDWHIYYPDDEAAATFMDWELADYGLINEKQPDYLLLERANVATYGDPDYLANSPDAERTRQMHLFYADALNGQIEGYRLVYEDGFGLVFQRSGE
jgi:hypothetical protein